MDFLAKGIFGKSGYLENQMMPWVILIQCLKKFTKHFRNLNVLEMESLELQKMVSQSTTQLAVIVAILHWKWVTIPPENGENFR